MAIHTLQLPTEEWSGIADKLPVAERCVTCNHHCYCVKPRTSDVHKLYPDGKMDYNPNVSILMCDRCAESYTLWLMQGSNVVVMNADKAFTVGRQHWNV